MTSNPAIKETKISKLTGSDQVSIVGSDPSASSLTPPRPRRRQRFIVAIRRGLKRYFQSLAIDEVLQQLPASSQEPWRVRRALISACSEQAKLFETNRDEWHASGLKPTQDEAKPWQKEAMRLQSEIEALQKQDKELSPELEEAFSRWKSDSQ